MASSPTVPGPAPAPSSPAPAPSTAPSLAALLSATWRWLAQHGRRALIAAGVGLVTAYVLNTLLLGVVLRRSQHLPGGPVVARSLQGGAGDVAGIGLGMGLYGLLALLISATVSYRLTVGRDRFRAELRELPTQLGLALRHDPTAALATLLTGAALAITSAAAIGPAITATVAAGLLLSARTPLGPLLASAATRALRPLHRRLLPRPTRSPPGSITVVLTTSATATALLLGTLLRTLFPATAIRLLVSLLLAAGLLLTAVLLRRARPNRPPTHPGPTPAAGPHHLPALSLLLAATLTTLAATSATAQTDLHPHDLNANEQRHPPQVAEDVVRRDDPFAAGAVASTTQVDHNHGAAVLATAPNDPDIEAFCDLVLLGFMEYLELSENAENLYGHIANLEASLPLAPPDVADHVRTTRDFFIGLADELERQDAWGSSGGRVRTEYNTADPDRWDRHVEAEDQIAGACRDRSSAPDGPPVGDPGEPLPDRTGPSAESDAAPVPGAQVPSPSGGLPPLTWPELIGLGLAAGLAGALGGGLGAGLGGALGGLGMPPQSPAGWPSDPWAGWALPQDQPYAPFDDGGGPGRCSL